ncbi:MAG: PAS domain S-box protein [Spongiibacteraceae bacterium]
MVNTTNTAAATATSTPANVSATLLADDPQQALRAEQLRLIFNTQHFNLIASVAITAVVGATLLPVTDSWRVIVWCGFMLLASAVRMAILIGWRRDRDRMARSSIWYKYLLLSSFLGGLSWGFGNLILFPQHGSEHQMLLVFITAGIASAAAITLAANPWVAWAFLLPCILPLELQMFLRVSGIGSSLGVLGLVYMFFLAGVIVRLHHYVKENVTLRFAERERAQLQNSFSLALRSSQEKLQALFELSPLGCILIRANGSMVDANQSFKRMLGYEDENFEAFFNIGISAPECGEENRRRWYELVKNGGTDAFETQFIRKDGSRISVSLHRMAVNAGDGEHYVWTIVEDITERKRHEEQLQALNTRLSLATQAGGIGVWEVDLSDNSLVWDDRMHAIYGLEPGTVATAGITADLVHPDDWEYVTSSMLEAINNPQSDRQVQEFRVVLANDNERWLRTAGLIQRDENGIARRIIGVAWDITELKRVARMKSEFVSSVSHELRTPLTSIRGSLGLVASGAVGELPAAAKDLIDIAHKNSERLSLLINDILDIEKIESGKMRLDIQPHSLRALLEQAIESNQGYTQNLSVYLQAQIDSDKTIMVDVNRFMQVMANLISNAVKFSTPGDRVDITALGGDGCVRIEVCDRGPGIPLDFRDRIFQRFSQADSSDTRTRGGSGLGLAITKTLVEKMHGTIGFVDRDGGGTVFYVELPSA